MNSRAHLEADIENITKTLKRVGLGVWAVAAFVMVYGVPVSFGPLEAHGVPSEVAWMPSLAADSAMVVAIIAGPVVAAYNVKAGWIELLRWTAAFTTWALQTAGSWLHPGGPDMPGVALHSLPPILLFAVGEGAAQFVRRMSEVRTAKRRELASAEQADADRRARYAEMESNLRATKAEASALASERETHLREIERLTSAVASTADAGTSTETALRATIGDLEAQLDSLHHDYENRLRSASNTHAEELRKVRRDASERIRQAELEASVPHLDAHRRGRNGGATKTVSGGGNLKPSNRSRISDEDAVQRLMETPSDPAKGLPSGDVREWSQQAIVNELGVGWTRAPRLLEQVTEAQQRRVTGDPSEDQAVGQ